MKISRRQKQIINPFPEVFSDSTIPGESTGGRNGNYDYENERNKWIIEGIQDLYLNYGDFPPIGLELRLIGPVTQENNILTISDALAYCALYPQNAHVGKSLSALVEGDPVYNPGVDPLVLKRTSFQDSEAELVKILKKLDDLDSLYKFITPSAPESLKAEFSFLNDEPTTGLKNLTGDRQEMLYTALTSRMSIISKEAIPPRVKAIRQSMGKNPEGPLISPPTEYYPLTERLILKQAQGLDFVSWTNNIGPSLPETKTYYNPRDNNVYYLFRTSTRDASAYDISNLDSNPRDVDGRLKTFRKQALRNIYEFCEKTLDEDEIESLSENVIVDTNYGDTYRPTPPTGYTVWILAAKMRVSSLATTEDTIPEIDYGPNNSGSSTLAVSKRIIESLEPVNSVVFTYEQMKRYVLNTIDVLKFYDNKLIEDGIDFQSLSGLRLDNEIIRLTQIVNLTNTLFESNGVILENTDVLEFRFDINFNILYYGVNGAMYFKGIGRDPDTLQLPDDSRTASLNDSDAISTRYLNYFESTSPTTRGYIFYSPEISSLATKLGSGELPPWTDFLPKYTYPNPNANSFLAQGIERAFGNKGKSTTYAGSFSNSPKKRSAQISGNGKDSKDPIKTSKQVEKVLRKRSKTEKQIYFIAKSAVVGCDTNFSKYLRSGLNIYSLYYRKADARSWLNLAIQELKVHLKEQKKAQLILTESEYYLNNPSYLEREVDKFVSGEIDKCIDAVGKAIFKEVISPSERPKNPKNYRKRSAKRRQKISIHQSATKNFLKPWWKKIKKMFMAYVKQLIMSVLIDVTKAALGCGPEIQSDKDTKSFIGPNFGLVQINTLLDAQLDVNYQQVAKNCGLLNRIPSIDENGNTTILVSDPTDEQLRQYHDDVSDFLTAEEALALLDGNAGDNTIFAINEMANKGPFSEEISTISEENRNNPLYTRQFQESLFTGDTKYATIGITPDNIISYFSVLGEFIENKDLQAEPLDPKLAYCIRREPGDGNLELGLSEAQLIKQIDRQLEVAQEKIKEQCEFFNQKLDIGTSLQGIFDGLGTPKAYDQFLAYTAEQSKRAQRSIFGQTAASAQQQIVPNPDENTQLYKFSEDVYGSLQSKSSISLDLTNSQAPSWYLGTPSESETDSNLGRVSFVLYDEYVEFYVSKFNRNTATQETNLICRVELSENNLSNAQWAPGYFGPGQNLKKLSLRGLATEEGLSSNPDLYPTTNSEMVNTISSLSEEAYNFAVTPETSTSCKDKNKFIFLTGTQYGEESYVKELIKDFYITDLATRRLKRYTDIFSDPFFTHTGDVCNPSREERIATALMESIQVRILNFFLNVGVLNRSIEAGWNTPDTSNSISNYLATKIQEEAANKGMLNVFYDALDDMSKTFSRNNVDGTISFNMENINDYSEMLVYVISQSLQSLYKRASKKRRFWKGFTNIYSKDLTDPAFSGREYSEPNQDFGRYMGWFKTGTFRFNIPSGDGVRTIHSERSDFSLQGDAPSLAPLELSSGDSSGGLSILQYYLPVPLINALQIIYFDQIIDVVGRFPSFRFYAGQRVAVADDSLLSAVNGTYTQVFTQPYDGYPITIEGITYYSAEEIQQRISLLRRQRDRVYELEYIFGPVAFYDDGYTSTGYATGLADDGIPQYLTKDLDEFRDFFNTIYGNSMQKYMDLYDTPEKRNLLYRSSIQYRFVTPYQEEFKDGRVSDPSVSAPVWIRERGWYERARLLGAAPSEGDSLIRKYEEGYDIKSTQRFTIDGMDLATKKSPGLDSEGNPIDETFGESLLKARAWMLNQNSYTPDPGVTSNLQDWWDNTGYWGIVGWAAVLTTAGVAVTTAVFSLAALGAALAGGGVIVGSIAALPGVAVAALLAAILALYILFFQDIDYEDPNSDNALIAIRNDVPLPNNPLEANDPHKRLPVDIVDDFIGAVEWFNTELKDGDGNPIHGNTLDKVAMNALYYELVWKSHYFKRRFELQNDASELNQLSDYLSLEEEEPGAFPVYFESKTVSAFGDTSSSSFGRTAFFSQQQIEEYILNLSNHPLMVERQEILRLKSLAERNLGLARRSIIAAEAGYAGRPDPIRDNILDTARAVVGGDFSGSPYGGEYTDLVAQTSLTDLYNKYKDFDEYMSADAFDELFGLTYRKVKKELSDNQLPSPGINEAWARTWNNNLLDAANYAVGDFIYTDRLGTESLGSLNNGEQGVMKILQGLVEEFYPRIRERAGGEKTFWGDYGTTPEGAKNLESYEQALDIVQSDIDDLQYILEELNFYGR